MKVHQNDKCPECHEGKVIQDLSRGSLYYKCDNCGAMWNTNGDRVAIGHS
jgi:uncharacterized Zn finger protein